MSEKRPSEECVGKTFRIKLSASPERKSASDTESIHSGQGYTTEVPSDTSGSSTSTSSTELYDPEYEVGSPRVRSMKYFFSGDSSEEERRDLKDFIPLTCIDELDNGVLADTSEGNNSTSPISNPDADTALQRNSYLDFKKCLLCKTDKKNTRYPYCSSCFTWRKNFFPPRPKRKKRSHRMAELRAKRRALTKVSKSSSEESETNENGSLRDERASCPATQALLEDNSTPGTEPLIPGTVGDPLHSTSNSQAPVDLPKIDGVNACRVCFVKPENGLFVHLTSAHLYGCYECAKKVWYGSGCCPLCRRKVLKITKLFF